VRITTKLASDTRRRCCCKWRRNIPVSENDLLMTLLSSLGNSYPSLRTKYTSYMDATNRKMAIIMKSFF
jgi:hypothetical protein